MRSLSLGLKWGDFPGSQFFRMSHFPESHNSLDIKHPGFHFPSCYLLHSLETISYSLIFPPFLPSLLRISQTRWGKQKSSPASLCNKDQIRTGALFLSTRNLRRTGVDYIISSGGERGKVGQICCRHFSLAFLLQKISVVSHNWLQVRQLLILSSGCVNTAPPTKTKNLPNPTDTICPPLNLQKD